MKTFQKLLIILIVSISSIANSEILLFQNAETMMVGDSITYLGSPSYLSELNRRDSSKVPLYFKFYGPYINGTTPNAGVIAEKTSDVLNRITSNLAYLPSSGKRFVMLHIGTNDLSTADAEETAKNNVLSIISAIDSYDSSIAVYVALIIPRNDANDSRTVTYNALLKSSLDSARLTKSNLFYADMYSRFTFNASWVADYMTDTLHPNSAGYAIIGNQWFSCIQSPTNQYCNGN